MSIAVDPRLSGPLERYNRRRKWLAVARGTSICLLVFVAVGLVLALVDFVWVLNQQQRWLTAIVAYAVAALTALLTVARPLVRRVALDDTAQQLELRVPDLKDHLRAAIELSCVSPDQLAHDSPQFRAMLRNRVIDLLGLVRISELLPWRLIQRWLFAALLAVAVILLAIAFPGSPLGPLLGRVLLPTANIAPITNTRITLLQPMLEQPWVPADEPLATVVRVDSDRPLRSPPRIELQPAPGAPSTFTMQPAGESSPQQWTAAWNVGTQPLRFRIVAGQGATIWYSLQPMPRPKVEQLHFRVKLPEYAQSDIRTLADHTGNVELITGSELTLAIAVDQPHVSATIDYRATTLDTEQDSQTLRAVSALRAESSEPSTANDNATTRTDSAIGASDFGASDFSVFPPDQWLTVDLPTTQEGRYRIRLRSLQTDFENAFPPLHQITIREDQPPVVSLQRLGTQVSFCLPRELLNWRADIIDEFPVASATLEYSINGGDYIRVPTSDDAPHVVESASDPVNYRVASLQRWPLDTESLSLRSGDQLRLQATVVDLKGQITRSEPVLLRVADEAFAANRHLYLQGHMQLLTLLRRWADLPLTDAEAALLSEPPQLTTAIDNTLRWLIENAPTAGDAVEMEWLARRLQQVSLLPAEDLDAISKIKQQLAEAADAFAASTAAAALFHDLLALDAHLADTIYRSANQPAAWLRRQSELYGAYQLDVASWLRTYHARLNETAGNTFRDRAERLEDQQGALVYTLDSQDDSQRWLDQLLSQRNSLENDLRNAFIHGDIPNRSRQALTKLITDFDRYAPFPSDVLRLAKQIDELTKLAAEANEIDQRQIVSLHRDEAAQKIMQANEPWTEMLRGTIAAHRLRQDFSPEWIADLELIINAVTHLSSLPVDTSPTPQPNAQNESQPESDTPTEEAPMSWQEHWRGVAEAAETLVRGNRFANVDALWRPLLNDERWATDELVRRVQNPRRWDYIGITLEQAARNARGHTPLRDLAGDFDRLRWDEPARSVGGVIGRRGWDPAVKASAADDLAIVHQHYLEALAKLEPPMHSARERLRTYLPAASPDSMDSDSAAPSQFAENNAPDNASDDANLRGDSPANDPQVSLLEQLAAALKDATESPEALLQRLEQRLTRDTPMQDELQSLTDNLLEQAVGGLEQIEQQQRETRNRLESRDPNVAAQQETTVAKLRDLGAQTQQLSEQLVARARSAAARGAVDDAPEKLQAAASQLQQASLAASRADTRQTSDEIAATAQTLSDALRAAQQPLEEAASQTASQHERVLEDNVGNRQRTRQQMQDLLNRTWKEQQRSAQQRQRQWEQQTQQAERNVRNARRELEKAQQQAAKAQTAAQSKPEDTARQQQWDQALEALAEAEQTLRARENQQQTFADKLEQAREDNQAAQQATPPRLAANNSAAEAATALAQQAMKTSEVLSEAATALAETTAAKPNSDGSTPAASGQPLQMTRNTAGDAARQLSNTQRELGQIADSLQRAGRHEARLGNTQRGQQLAAAGSDLRALADEVVRPAMETAEAASSRQSLQRSPQSVLADARPLDNAASQIQDRVNQQIEQLQQLVSSQSPESDAQPASTGQQPGAPANDSPAPTNTAGNTPTSSNPAPGSTPGQPGTPANNSAANNSQASNSAANNASADMFASPQQAARLLDDVDRLLNQSGPGTPLQSSALLAEAAAASQRQQARAGEPATANNSAASSPTSPNPATLAEALTPSSSQANSDTATPSGNTTATSGAGDLLRSASVPTGNVASDWAKLRERRTEDAGQAEQTNLPPEYREQIEAYFRAIAERSK